MGLSLASFSSAAQFGTTIYSSDFTNNINDWKALSVGGSYGSFETINGTLKVQLDSGEAYGAYYSALAFSGHFEVEVEFEEEEGVALGLLKAINGKPSVEDYSMIKISKNDEGVLEVKITDMQNGQKDVLDHTRLAKRSRYIHLLNGTEYSIPFKSTANKLRILRHKGEQFLHFYYAVEKEVNGKIYKDWMELAPSKEWGSIGEYYVGVFSFDGTVNYDNIKVSELPKKDVRPGDFVFEVEERPFTWSGYTDNALVVSFGKEFPFAKEGHQFVFWALNNNIPVWYINNAALFSHGFVETWDGGNLGCHEPMSDRLLAFTDLEILEDNKVRKVIKWTYQLVDPDYKHPDHGKGNQMPEATEYYYIYADGTIIRKIQYAPKLDTEFRNWHELMELILIAGENNRPKDLLEYPSLSFYENGKAPVHYNNEGELKYRNNNKRLGVTTMVAHVKDSPDLFYAFTDDKSIPETFSEYPLNYEITWHKRTNNFGHWPVTKEPYASPFKSGSSWPQQIAHTSLIGMGVDLGRDWQQGFSIRQDGRKYREWLSLMGMNKKDGSVSAREKVNSWLFGGSVNMMDNSSSYIGYSYQDRYFEFRTLPKNPKCRFNISVENKLIHPVIKIKQWGQNPIKVKINNELLASYDLIKHLDDKGDLLLLILKTYEGDVEVETFPEDP